MACNIEFIEGICEALRPLGDVHYRKMMGDYVVYVNEKCVITACDNLAYIKKLPSVEELMVGAETGCAYPGAKEGYILSFGDPAHARRVIAALWEDLPFPKKKKNR